MSENIATLVRFFFFGMGFSKFRRGNVQALALADIHEQPFLLPLHFGKCRDWANASISSGIIVNFISFR